MKKYKALYQAMYDDLKDAEMMIDYACDILHGKPEDKPLADEFAKYSKYRLDHFMSFHKILMAEVKKGGEVSQETATNCLWKQTHEHMQEWYDCIQKKISKY